ncbi:MAG: CBS domain-containing protein [Proteobacteria bacterium]|nr:MAG: CBS domain-containing protein [Pseudomonadota bacterium]
MLAENTMVTEVTTAHVNDRVCDVLERMRATKLRMLPVVDDAGIVAGVISTFSIMENLVPSYIVSGDLNQIPYAPDMGILRRHYLEVIEKDLLSVMETKPLLVKRDESLLSTAAALTAFGKHEYALVVDEDKRLIGVISAGDILDRLGTMVESAENDA